MLHIFDVDYTLIRKSSSYYFLLEALRQKAISFKRLKSLPVEWLRYKFGAIHSDFIEQAVQQLGGIEEGTIDRVAETCFDRVMRHNIYSEGFELVQRLRSEGNEVRLATSSFYSIVRPLEAFLGLSHTIASRLEFEAGKTTGRILGRALFGENKRYAVEAVLGDIGVDPADFWFYSDSYTDIPLLELAGHPVVVNPDRFLLKKAASEGWEVRRFRNTLSCQK